MTSDIFVELSKMIVVIIQPELEEVRSVPHDTGSFGTSSRGAKHVQSLTENVNQTLPSGCLGIALPPSSQSFFSPRVFVFPGYVRVPVLNSRGINSRI